MLVNPITIRLRFASMHKVRQLFKCILPNVQVVFVFAYVRMELHQHYTHAALTLVCIDIDGIYNIHTGQRHTAHKFYYICAIAPGVRVFGHSSKPK